MADQRQPDQDWLGAARLVRRTGFGATGAQVDAVVASGTTAFLAAAQASDAAADAGVAQLPTPTFSPLSPLGENADTAARNNLRSQITDQLRELTAWWLRRERGGSAERESVPGVHGIVHTRPRERLHRSPVHGAAGIPRLTHEYGSEPV
jgi:hypothetical protein